MNYIRHLTGFFDRACKDHRLNPTHISLYMAIFQLWNINRFKNPLSIARSEIMELSKVSSKNTYHKCLKELHLYGYLRYDPSYHPLRGSWVYLFVFKTTGETNQYNIGTSDGQVVGKLDTGNVQAEDGLAAESYAGSELHRPLNISKHIKPFKLSFSEISETARSQEKEKKEVDELKNNFLAGAAKNDAKQTAGQDKDPPATADSQLKEPERRPADIEAVIEFFLASKYQEAQAIKFFYYYKATGWKVGGKSPIEDWHAAAHSWMLNPHNTSSNGNSQSNQKQTLHAKQLHSPSNKNYAEPL